MKRIRSGFTLVEVSLFLAITAAVFVGVAVGTSNSIFQQRYNDAVQNYVEFLRTVYSQVSNVQSEGTGRSDKAIYGKLVTFGAKDGRNKINTYNVIGDLEENSAGSSSGDVLDKLGSLNINVVVEKENEDFEKVYEPVGFVDDYTPRWTSQIQTTAGWDEDGLGGGYKIFEGSLLIVRSPSTGTVYTYVSNVDIDVDAFLEDDTSEISPNLLADLSSFSQKDVDFCINPNGSEKSNLRRDVRIIAGARNASGIEIVKDEIEEVEDGDDGVVNIGNRCR